MQAGDWASSVPDRLVAEGRYGVRLGEPVEAAKEAFAARLATLSAAHPWLAEHPVRLTWTGGAFASGELPTGHPLLPAVRQAVTDAGGGLPAERAIAAGSDLRQYVGGRGADAALRPRRPEPGARARANGCRWPTW